MESFLDNRVILHCGDNREVLKAQPDCSVDSIVTDPPYALVSIVKRFGKAGSAAVKVPEGGSGAYARASAGFMGKEWDTGETAFAAEFWAECLRVLKPGGHVVAFSGTRTYHRMACAIEDAGFEVRNMLSWNFGSGFPKSHNISKTLDDKKERCACPAHLRGLRHDLDSSHSLPGRPQQDMRPALAGQPKPQTGRAWEDCGRCGKPMVPDGLGTDLKPAHEPICLARKPLASHTIAANVLLHGTGAMNIDACRVGSEGGTKGCDAGPSNGILGNGLNGSFGKPVPGLGRWPANIIHDGSEEVLAAFPESAGQQGDVRGTEPSHTGDENTSCYGEFGRVAFGKRADSGSAARFFYTAKADADDRIGSKHPTVKPVDLMQWLVRLVTPKGGVVLDPFAGTGTTGEAAFREGMRAILIEREPEYQADIRRRMALVMSGPDERKRESIKAKMKDKPADAGPLFEGLEL